ncbi:MAG: DNA alkylation repair protein [Inquilinaceae bacterium]
MAGLARYGIPNDHAVGAPMSAMKAKARTIGRDHALALALWQRRMYEARTMAVFLADPAALTADQADAWCADFDNWAICDTACFHLLDRTPFAWDMVDRWAPDPREFVRRAGFALIWALSVHDKISDDAVFIRRFDLFRAASSDERPLVRKAVDMALRATGKRTQALNGAALSLARELALRDDRPGRWIGRHASRELESDKVQAKWTGRGAKRKGGA